MAINVQFNGATIYKPGAYSQELIDLGGGFPVGPTGLVAIFGESTTGAPGAQTPDISQNVFQADQLPMIRNIYGSGPIVDACTFLFAPGADGAIPGGAQSVYIYKTNASTQASLTLANTYGSLLADVYGNNGNQITYANVLVPAVPAETASTATFNMTAISAGGSNFTIRTNGGASTADNTFTAPASTTTRALLQTALTTGANWSQTTVPAGITFTVSGTADTAVSIDITQSLGSNAQRNGAGQNFQLIAGSPDMLALTHLTAGLHTSESEDMSVITVNNNGTNIKESGTVGGNIVLTMGRAGGVAPHITINATQMLLINNSATEYAITLSNFPTITALVNYINSSTGGNWSATIASALYGQLSPSVLDEVTALPANGSGGSQPAQIKNDASAVQQFFAASVNVTLLTPKAVGLPDASATTYLAGGALGGTQTSDITNALTALQAVHVNSMIPLFSRDATADIADQITDPSSNYTILGIHQATVTYLSLMATTKNRSESQGYLSLKDTYANCKIQSQNLAYERVQLEIQDIKQVNSLGQIQWFLPWAGSCLLAGARGGSPIGLPMTHKYFNMSGIRQTAQPLSTPEANIVQDFNPLTQYDDAIQNGITFWEHPTTGGYRLVVDNTTYGQDANWVKNRGNVQYAADVLAYDFRNQLENIYVGVKNTVSAAEVKSTCDAILTAYLAQGITVSTTDAPNGYKQLVVQIVGNTINISVIVKLVEGIDFILATITLQRASSSA